MLMIAMYWLYYKAYLDYMDPNVWYLSNADKLDHSIAPVS